MLVLDRRINIGAFDELKELRDEIFVFDHSITDKEAVADYTIIVDRKVVSQLDQLDTYLPQPCPAAKLS